MKKIYDTIIGKVLAGKKRQKIAAVIVLVLCIAIIPLVTILSSQTAMTEKIGLICEIEEHIHVEKCFNTLLECNLPEIEEHTHDSDCYNTKSALICKIEESPEHSHNETCYEEVQNLMCIIKETYTHTKDCYSYKYSCGLEENENEHIHTEDCLAEEPKLTCSRNEILPHTHSEECNITAAICEHEEHTHGDDCFAAVQSNITAKDMMQTMSVLSLNGTGTPSDPYVIYTAEELQMVAEAVNSGDAKYKSSRYELGADIDLSIYNASNTSFNNGKGWIPIGTSTNPFNGTFLGDNYGISGLYINDPNLNYAGLFGYVDGGIIQRLGVSGSAVRGCNYVGGLVGCIVNGYISYCYSNCDIYGAENVGGLIGYIGGSNNNILKVYTTRSVNATTGNVGGIVGGVQNSGTHTIEVCYATGEINGTATTSSSGVGGIIGIKNASLSLKKCAALNIKVSSSLADNAKRVVSNKTGGSLSALYGFSDMLNAAGNKTWTTPSPAADNANGANMTAANAGTVTYWTSTVGFSSTDWTLEANKLPILKGVGGVQSSSLPHHLGGNGFSGGTGTIGSPYIITTAEQLAWLSEKVNAGDADHSGAEGKEKHYKLGNDIDISLYGEWVTNSKGKGWIPIGDTTDTAGAFRGTFDGDGKKITGLYIDRKNVTNAYSALFGYVYGATIKNLGVTDVNIQGHVSTAGIVASLADGGTIEGCYVTGEITGYQAVGGIVGVINNGGSGTITINKCYTTCTVTAENFRVGGIAGNSIASGAVISNCYTTGAITNTISAQTAQAGGILGNSGGGSVAITNCYSTGNITSKNIAGGIVGGTGGGACTVTNCAALNLKISGDFDENTLSKRIRGGGYATTFTNNRAYDGLKNRDEGTNWIPAGTLTNENGQNMTEENATDAVFWEDSMKFNGSTTWHLQDGLLPMLKDVPEQTGKPHFPQNTEESDHIALVPINCEKTISGSGAPIDKEFKFKLTEVDKNGTPIIPLFEMEKVITGAGDFQFKVPVYETGTHYYRIVEEAGIRDGWIYDDHAHIIEVNVADDAGHTVTTSLDGVSESYFKVTFGSPTTIHAKPSPIIIFDVNLDKRYNFSGSSYTNFIISEGIKKYFGLCGNYSLHSPSSKNDIYQQQSNGGRNDTSTALASALCVSSSGGFQNGTGLTEAEYASLFNINTPAYSSRRSSMQGLVWHYENNEGISSAQKTLRNIIDEMIEASKNTPKGESITSLSLGYNENTGRLTFTHVGYQPLKYDTRLSWSGDTAGLTVTVNGKNVSSGVAVKKTDVITVTYTGTGTVEFFLNDNQLYLKAGSVKGAVLKNVTNSRVQPCSVGSAEFVKIQNSFKITRGTISTAPTNLSFANRFEALPVTSATITGNKTITGIGSTNEIFTFNLTQVTDIGGATSASPLYTDSTTITGAGTFNFNISGLHSGTYFFRIEEDVENPSAGWSYDNIPRVVRVDVSDDATPIVTITYPDGGLTFNNSYKPPGGASAVIEGEKQIYGVDAPNQIFAFSIVQVADETGLIPYTQGVPYMDSEITIGAGTFKFELKDLMPGTYYYKIIELTDVSATGWNYDSSIYIATVTVTDVGLSEYSVNVSYKKNESAESNIIFSNTFISPPNVEAVINGAKEIVGIDSTDQEFKFILQRVTDATGSEFFLPIYNKEAVTIGADDFSFTILDLLPGTYYYKITEDTSDPDARWKYDQSVYIVTVTVTEELEVTVKYPDEADEIRFSNRLRTAGLLPETGGIGTDSFFMTAIMLTIMLFVFLSGTLIYKSHRRRKFFKIK